MGRLTNKYKIHIIIFILTNLLYGCFESKYALPKYFSGGEEISLYKNGKFYILDYQPMLGRTDYYGDWTENNDTIYLNIKRTRHINSYEATEFIVKELHNENRDSIYFEIKVGHCSTNSGTLLIDGEEIWVNENGFAQISKQKIKQIIFNPGICYAEINFNITDTTANYFQIELKNSFEPAFTCSTKYIKKITKLIPVIYDSVLTEFTLRRKLFADGCNE